jgi:hypothetical protein
MKESWSGPEGGLFLDSQESESNDDGEAED